MEEACRLCQSCLGSRSGTDCCYLLFTIVGTFTLTFVSILYCGTSSLQPLLQLGRRAVLQKTFDLQHQKPLDVQNWNLDMMWVLMNALCKLILGAPGHVTKILRAKNGQKVDNFKIYIYIDNYRYWWKMVCDFWAHHQLPFFWLCSFTPTWKLFFLFSYFFFLFFSSYLL